MGVTPGANGPIVVKAMLDSSDLPAVEFNLTGTQAADPGCPLGPPSLTSVKSAGDVPFTLSRVRLPQTLYLTIASTVAA